MLIIAAYLFTEILDGPKLVAQLRARACELQLKGTVLVAPEGINLFLAGENLGIDRFVFLLKEDSRFAEIHLKYSENTTIPFRRLKVKWKREIITFGHSNLNPAKQRAPAVTPKQLQRWLQQGADDQGKPLVLLDTRNQCEVRYGTFQNAVTLPIDRFTELPKAIEAQRAALTDKTIVSFCTGGIRCEKAALWLQEAGLGPVYQLDGGILNYFEKVGQTGYRGTCFVFDEREALDAGLKSMHATELC